MIDAAPAPGEPPLLELEDYKRLLSSGRKYDLCDAEHRRWQAERALRGVTLGSWRSDVLQRPPEMKPYSELGPAQTFDEKQINAAPQILAQARQGLRPRLVVGVIGPGASGAPSPELDAARPAIRAALVALFKAARTPLGSPAAWAPLLLTNGAPGVDRIAMEAADSCAVPVWLALPMPVELYAEQIAADAGPNAAAARSAFETAAAAQICVSVPFASQAALALRNPDDPAARDAQYRKAAELLVARSDLLVVVRGAGLDGVLTREMAELRRAGGAKLPESAFFPAPGRALLELDPAAPPADFKALLELVWAERTTHG